MRRPNGYGGIVKLSGKRRKPYQVRLTAGWENIIDDNGEVKSRQIIHILGSYPTYQEANMALAIYNNDPYDLALKNITFEEAYKIALEKKGELSKSTLNSYRTAYNKVKNIYKKPIIKLRRTDLQMLINSEDTEPKQQQLIKLFNLVYNWAENDVDLIKDNPCKHLEVTAKEKEKREGQPYTPEEIKRLWYHVHRNDFPGAQHIDSVLIQIYTGVRIMELLTLKKEDVHLDERYAIVRGTKNKNAVRIVPLRKEIIPLLKVRLEDTTNLSEYFFLSVKGKLFCNSQHYSDICFDSVRKELFKTEHITHDARHTFISRADDSGINENALKKIVGHSLSGVTGKAYTHKDIKTLIQEVDKIKFL